MNGNRDMDGFFGLKLPSYGHFPQWQEGRSVAVNSGRNALEYILLFCSTLMKVRDILDVNFTMKLLSIICMLVFSLTTHLFAQEARLSLPSSIGDHMVIRQNSKFLLYGWCGTNVHIAITPSWNPKAIHAQADEQGRWRTEIETPPAGGPHSILIVSEHGDKIEIKDILSGEVWLCSGQSNMTWSVQRATPAIAKDFPKAPVQGIRLFQVDQRASNNPQDEVSGSWKVCDPESLRRFSMVGYYFGQRLHDETGIPVGLVHASWGGTPIEAWMPENLLKQQDQTVQSRRSRTWANKEGLCYNGMIDPLKNVNFSGIIWYQGEANVDRSAPVYAANLTAMVEAWRDLFRDKKLPFYFVQIAPFVWPQPLSAAVLREQQEKAMTLPHTGMVVISDTITDTKDIHPPQKKEVGRRLAGLALKELYGKSVLNPYSPCFEHVQFQENMAIVTFKNTEKLVLRDEASKKPCVGFEIAGSDKKFVPADATLKGRCVIVTSPFVQKPAYVRFSFSNDCVSNLFGENGLPATPFRTDDFSIPLN